MFKRKLLKLRPTTLPVLFLVLLLMAFGDIGFVLVNLHVTFPQLSSQLKIATTVVGWIVVAIGFAIVVWYLIVVFQVLREVAKISKSKRKEPYGSRDHRRVYG